MLSHDFNHLALWSSTGRKGSMPAAPTAAPPNRRPHRERRANSRYEDDVDPEDEAALLSGDAPQVGRKRKDPAPEGASVFGFGSPLSIPRRARSLRMPRDGDSDQSAAGGSGNSSAHGAAAALQFGRRPPRMAGKRQSAAPPDDQAVAELLLGMGDIITARTESPPSSSDGEDADGGGSPMQRQQRPARRRQKSAKVLDRWDGATGARAAAPRAHSRRHEPLSPPPPSKRRAAVAAVSAIAAAAASDKAPSDDETHLGIADAEAAPPARKLARPPPKGEAAGGDARERSRLAGPVAPADGYDETLRHVHQVCCPCPEALQTT